MVAKIRLEAEDATGPAFDSLNKSADSAQSSLDDVQSSMNQTQASAVLLASGFSQTEVAAMSASDRVQMAEIAVASLDAALGTVTDNLIDVEKELGSLADDAYKAAAAAGQAAHGIDRTGDEAAQSAEQVRKLDAALEKTGSSGGSFVESMAKLWALKETFTKLAQGANYLAEQGNPAFVGLRDSATKLLDALMKLTELEEVQTFINTVSSGFEGAAEFIATNAENVDWLIKQYKGLVEVVVEYLEYMGIVAEGTTEELRRMKELEAEESKRYEQKLAAEKEAIQAKKQQAEADKALHEFERSRAAASEADAAKQIQSEAEIARLQEAEIERMKKLASEAKLTAEEQQDSIRRVQMWEQRKGEIQKEQLDKVAKEKEEAAKSSEDLAKKEADAQAKAAEKAAADAKAANDEKLKDFETYVNKLISAVESTKQGDGAGMDASLREATSGKNLLKGVVEKRQLEAEQGLREQRIAEGKTTDGKDFERERAKLFKQVERQTVKEANKGEISAEELGAVQEDLAKNIIDQGEKSGQLGKNAAAALREQAKAIASQNVEMEKQARDLAEVQSFMAQMNGRNERRVSQRRG